MKAFEAWYEETYGAKVHVNYTTYASNEDMYAKLKSGAVSYDVIIPSDYMIARHGQRGHAPAPELRQHPQLPIHRRAASAASTTTRTTPYSVPYTYGVVGVIYDANQVDEADAGGWDLMWNAKYKGKILQFNNSRDAFGTAMYRAGIDVNTTDKSQWEAALQALLEQRPLVKSLRHGRDLQRAGVRRGCHRRLLRRRLLHHARRRGR